MAKEKNPAVAALREARDRIASLTPDADDIRPELRFAFRNGHAAARNAAQTVINRMLASLGE